MSWMAKNIGKKHTVYKPVNRNKFLNPEGYAVCRSGWETEVCKWLDHNPNVIHWGSELFAIEYVHPYKRDGKGLPRKAKYFPDYYVEIREKDLSITKIIIEVKPAKECKPSRKSGKKSKDTLIHEEATFSINTAKWKAASLYCEKMGWKFKILTEKDLFGK
jgi:hypothetical protein